MTAYQPAPQNFAPPPGWYRDPSGPGERWWTGMQWSEHARENAAESNGMGLLIPQPSTYATRALVWGIIAIVLPLAFLPGIFAIFFGGSALGRETAKERQGLPSKRGRALAGLILGIVAIGLAVTFFVVIGVTAQLR